MVVINGRELSEVRLGNKEVSSIMLGDREIWSAANFWTADNRTLVTADGKTFNVNKDGEIHIQVYRRGD